MITVLSGVCKKLSITDPWRTSALEFFKFYAEKFLVLLRLPRSGSESVMKLFTDSDNTIIIINSSFLILKYEL